MLIVYKRSRLTRHHHNNFLRRFILFVMGILGIGVVVVIPWAFTTLSTPPSSSLGNSPLAIEGHLMKQHPPVRSAKEVNAVAEEQKHDTLLKVSREQDSSGRDKYHTVFSTGCSIFQDWQSYVLFYHMLHSGQEGPVTRIASGCNSKDSVILRKVFDEEIAVMAPGRFRLHLTPDFARIKPGINFKYFNKPYGMKHWMQEALGYPDNHKEHDDTIIILLDPDQILVRAFTDDFTHSYEEWRVENKFKLKVEHGSPFAANYGYGLQWKRNVNVSNVFQGHSPVIDMTDSEARDYYWAMGPPYIATGKDMYTLVRRWSEIVPRVHDEYPFLLAEMFAFNLAAAHEGLRFTIAHSFVVSDVFTGGEGWKLIDFVPEKDICRNFPKSEYPHVIHYCQRYYYGKWFIGKYKLRKDFISCESPLLVMPPANLATQAVTVSITPNGERMEKDPKFMKREAFMVCTMIRTLNEAAIYFKDHHCNKDTANYENSYVFHEDMSPP